MAHSQFLLAVSASLEQNIDNKMRRHTVLTGAFRKGKVTVVAQFLTAEHTDAAVYHRKLDVSAINCEQVQTVPETIRRLTREKSVYAGIQKPVKSIQMDSLSGLGKSLFRERYDWFSHQVGDYGSKTIQKIIDLIGKGCFSSGEQKHHHDAHCQFPDTSKTATDAILFSELLRIDVLFDRVDNQSANLRTSHGGTSCGAICRRRLAAVGSVVNCYFA